jgi:hypothetical protein
MAQESARTANTRTLRKKTKVWLIGYPKDTITGARLPSGRDVMRNFIHHLRVSKLSIAESSQNVYDQLVQFWMKSRLPIRDKQHIIRKVKELYNEQSVLMKNRSRNNAKDVENQREYSSKLDSLFDISHAAANELIKNDEDRIFLQQQRESRTGCIGPLDQKLAKREQRAAKRQQRFLQHAQMNSASANHSTSESESSSTSRSEEESESGSSEAEQEEFVVPHKQRKVDVSKAKRRRRDVVSKQVAAVLDRTNTSVRRSTMILASAINEAGCSTSAAILSKSTVHRLRKQHRVMAAQEIRKNYHPTKSVVHWDGKLLPDVTGVDTNHVDRLPVLLSSLVDGETKLLGVPKLTSGTGQAAAEAIHELLNSWECSDLIVGMCFDTTSANTGRINGACTLLENIIGRRLLWMACRHHILEVLLADAFGVCLGPSTGPDILMFKRFREKWSKLKHRKVVPQQSPIITVDDNLKAFITEQLRKDHCRDDYRELLNLAALMIGKEVDVTIRKPGALHRARWMAKAIYSLKIELLLSGNETVMELTGHELLGLQRFNRFVVCVYLRSWFTTRSAVDAPINDMQLIQRLEAYDDEALRTTGLNMMKRHSWYLSPELATLALFSDKLTCDVKAQLVLNMTTDRGPHLLKSLPHSVEELSVSRSFFQTLTIDDSFLALPVETWSHTPSYNAAAALVRNLSCVNDCAERGVALMHLFNESITKDEEQKQFLMQVVEKHRKDFKECNRDSLKNM